MNSDASTKLQVFIDNLNESQIRQICEHATCKEEVIILFIYKEIFKNEEASEDFCHALKSKEIADMKDELEGKIAEELLSEIGMDLILDSIPYFISGIKVIRYIKQKI